MRWRLKTILEWGWKIEYANLTVTTAGNHASSTSPDPAYELRDADGNGFYDTLVINTHDPGAFGMSQQAATSTVAERLSQGIWDNRITSLFVGRPLEDPIAEGMAAAWDEMVHRSSRGVVGMGNGAIGGTASGAAIGGAIGTPAGLLGTLAGGVIGGIIGGISGAFTGFLHGYSNPGMSDKQLKHESLGLGLASGFSAAPVIANSIASSARVVTIGATGKNAAGGIGAPSGIGGRFVRMNPHEIRFSQTTAGGKGRAAQLRESMRNGWNGPAVDAVQTPEGIVTIDNTRIAIARELGITEVPVVIHMPSDPLPASMLGRFGDARTWGEALHFRTSRQLPSLPPTGTSSPPQLPN